MQRCPAGQARPERRAREGAAVGQRADQVRALATETSPTLSACQYSRAQCEPFPRRAGLRLQRPHHRIQPVIIQPILHPRPNPRAAREPTSAYSETGRLGCRLPATFRSKIHICVRPARTTKPPKAPSVLNRALPDARARPSRKVAGHDQMGPGQQTRRVGLRLSYGLPHSQCLPLLTPRRRRAPK